MNPCLRCKGTGFAWGGLLRSPQILRHACSGGPEQAWHRTQAAPAAEAATEVPLAATPDPARVRRERVAARFLRGGAG